MPTVPERPPAPPEVAHGTNVFTHPLEMQFLPDRTPTPS